MVGTPWAADTCDCLTETYGPRFTTPALLQEMADKGQSFYHRFGGEKSAA